MRAWRKGHMYKQPAAADGPVHSPAVRAASTTVVAGSHALS
jgi:hypothetical protein